METVFDWIMIVLFAALSCSAFALAATYVYVMIKWGNTTKP